MSLIDEDYLRISLRSAPINSLKATAMRGAIFLLILVIGGPFIA